MVARGVARARKAVREAKAHGRETTTRAGARLMRDLPMELGNAINAWKADASVRPGTRHAALEKIGSMDTMLVACLALKTVLDGLTVPRTFASMALNIASRLEDEEKYAAFEAQSQIQFVRAQQRCEDFTSYGERRRHILRAMVLFGISRPEWSRKLRANVGTVLLDLVVATCGIVETTTVTHNKRTIEMVHPTEEAIRWVDSVNEWWEVRSPMHLPFVEKPLDWVSPLSGGYHSTDLADSALVKTRSREALAALEGSSMPEVYNGLNYIQGTAWRLNEEVWQVFSYLWENELPAAGIPRKDIDPMPAKPADIETNELARKAWRAAARQVHDNNHRKRSDRLFAAKLHMVCSEYHGKVFWFCWQLDWRGRAYPKAYYLNPQGGDLTRGLLTFAEGRPVTSEGAKRWHRIHGANCWGLDKKTFAERIQWTHDNWEMILRVGEDPLVHRDWEDAESPWQFMAWCLDCARLHENPGAPSSLPIHQDATQSGIQIYALMLRDVRAAELTNCRPCEQPQDLYGEVASRTRAELQLQADDGVQIAADWLKFGVDRSCAKRPVMTSVYNATQHSAMNYVREWATDKADKEDKPIPVCPDGEGSGIAYLTHKLWKAKNEVTSSVAVGQVWLSEVARIFAREAKPILWTAPSGFPVRQWYPEFGSEEVKTRLKERFRYTKMRVSLDSVNARRMRSAFAPNYVHSLDASLMLLTANRCSSEGISQFSPVHDSFATVAADSEQLAKVLRETYVNVFSQDILASLRDHLQSQVDTPLPPLPPYGTLDVRDVLDSPYFFN